MPDIKCPKRCFRTKKEAKEYMKKQNKRWDFGYTNAYFCEECQSYHLTTKPKQASRDFTRFLNKQK